MIMRLLLPSLVLTILLLPGTGLAEPINFDRDIRPILSDKCFRCHGPDKNARKAKLRLDTREGLLADLDGYSAVVPGNPNLSELVVRIKSDDKTERMPPAKSKLSLSPKQIQLLTTWIAQGAKWQQHWSFEKPIRPAPPKIKLNAMASNAIDHFILARLEAEGLSPSKQAPRQRLIRRLSLDLTGLPPTPAEIDAFIADKSPNAYEKLIDRLLASPRFGERMAWDWLDAARYADTNGYQGDNERTMWPWRDWVVTAFNQNLPFDQFTIWQLAGDLMPQATMEQKLATGFNRNHMINGEGGRIAEENRIEYIFDQIETVGTVWMALTLTCSRCHDHKYDPMTQKEYYQLSAFFNQTPVNGGGGNPQTAPVIAFPGKEQTIQVAKIENRIAELKQQISGRTKKLAPQRQQWERQQLAKLGSPSKNVWQVLKPTAVKAIHQKLTILEDNSILASGPNPAKDTYTITATTNLKHITGMRLEALRHKSMTKNGLSRSDSGNFVLTEFEVQIRQPGQKQTRRIKIGSAQATFEQGNLKIKSAFDGKPNTGWAVYQGRPVDRDHAGVFRFAKPLDVLPGTELIVTLRHDSPHKNHNLGRLRLSITDQAQPKLTKGPDSLAIALGTPANKRSKAQNDQLAAAYFNFDATSKKLKAELKKQEQQLTKLRKGFPRVMVMADMPTKRKTYVLNKGLYNQRGAEVSAGVPRIFPPLAQKTKDPNRLALARWLVDPSNPLVARVTINRYWQMLMGTGLVKTTENFGTQGQKPSHPDLLDWLAVQFVESGWDVKAMVKLIVMSRTYRQSSKTTAQLLQRDPENRLLAHGPRFRMPSWMIRDQALAVSGLLVDKRGGPSVKPYQPKGIWAEATFGKKRYVPDKGDKLYRRSLYTYWRRIVGPTMFFDAAKRQVCSVKSPRTNTPLHALTTLNDITYVEAARAMAQRVMQSAKPDARARIVLAFRLATSRKPNEPEIKLLLGRLEILTQQYTANKQDALKLLKVGDSPRDEKIDPVEHAAYTGLCSLILNLDETLTN